MSMQERLLPDLSVESRFSRVKLLMFCKIWSRCSCGDWTTKSLRLKLSRFSG